MVALLCFLLTLLASPFKSKPRLEAENAVLRHQLIVLQRQLRGRVQFTNSDRLFFIQLFNPHIDRLMPLRLTDCLRRERREKEREGRAEVFDFVFFFEIEARNSIYTPAGRGAG
jgi:hypothetical protein